MRLAHTPTAMAALKQHLEAGRSGFALFDTTGYCRKLERAFETIWARHGRGEPASEIYID